MVTDRDATTPGGSPAREPVAATGYTLVLPPGWSRIPVRRGTDQAIASVIDGAFADAPRDKLALVRHQLRQHLTELAARAREGAAVDLYLPTRRVGDVALTCSVVVAEIHQPGPWRPNPPAVLARLFARREGCRPITVPAGSGARSDRVAPADPAQGVEHASRRVDYVLPVPEDPDRWVIVSFSTLGAGDPGDDFAELQVELFDALMTTFRWRTG